MGITSNYSDQQQGLLKVGEDLFSFGGVGQDLVWDCRTGICELDNRPMSDTWIYASIIPYPTTEPTPQPTAAPVIPAAEPTAVGSSKAMSFKVVLVIVQVAVLLFSV